MTRLSEILFVSVSILFGTAYSLGYNATCTTGLSDECDIAKGFKCSPDLLQCKCRDDAEMSYNESYDLCEVYIGGKCTTSKNGQLKCKDQFGLCLDEKCTCWGAHQSSAQNATGPDVKCLPAYINLPCDEPSLPCHPGTGMECRNGACRCAHPLKQIFGAYEDRMKCVGMLEIEGSCKPEDSRLDQCPKNAHCGQDRKCHCDPGWSSTFEFPPVCKLSLDQKCDIMDNQCNSDRGLNCLGGSCRCDNDPDTYFDQNKQVCAVTEGNVCNLAGASIYAGSLSRIHLTCGTGLACARNGDNPYYGVCCSGGSYLF